MWPWSSPYVFVVVEPYDAVIHLKPNERAPFIHETTATETMTTTILTNQNPYRKVYSATYSSPSQETAAFSAAELLLKS